MRPATLAEAIERIVDGTPQEKALPEFLDTIYLAPTTEQQLATIPNAPQRRATIGLMRWSGRRLNIWRAVSIAVDPRVGV